MWDFLTYTPWDMRFTSKGQRAQEPQCYGFLTTAHCLGNYSSTERRPWRLAWDRLAAFQPVLHVSSINFLGAGI